MSYLARPGATTTPASTPVGRPLPGRRDMVRNTDGGGFVFELDDWARVRRWLILGSEMPTYYASQKRHSAQAFDAVYAALRADGARFVALAAEVSDGGLARRNDEALYALALAVREGDEATKAAAYAALPTVARIGTHMFMFLAFLRDLAGRQHIPGGPGLRRAVTRWIHQKGDGLAYQAIKYRDREGVTWDDVLRVAHPRPADERMATILEWIALPPEGSRRPTTGTLPPIIEGFLKAQREAATPSDTAALVREYRLPHEALKTEHKTSPEVNMALLEAGMPMTALVRNLANMTRYGVLERGSAGERIVLDQLANGEALRKARVHPMALLIALFVYHAGRSETTGNTWIANATILDAMDEAFYLSFGNLEPTGKRRLVAIDVSASMTTHYVAGVPGMQAMTAAMAMALTAVHTDDVVDVVAISNGLTPLPITRRARIDDVWRRVQDLPFQSTDLSLPPTWAKAHAKDYDSFEVWTDNEVNRGAHPSAALREYRKVARKPDARMVVGGLAATPFTIADPRDAGMLDVVGMDASAPAMIAEFLRGRV